MLGSLFAALLASPVLAGSAGEAVNAFAKRNLIGPISTDNPSGIAGGTVSVASDGIPVSSFFAGLKPPVCEEAVLPRINISELARS